MIIFDNKKFRCLIKDEDKISDMINFILAKNFVNSSSFLSLGKTLAKKIVKRNNNEQEINNDKNEHDKQSENENIEWISARI